MLEKTSSEPVTPPSLGASWSPLIRIKPVSSLRGVRAPAGRLMEISQHLTAGTEVFSDGNFGRDSRTLQDRSA